MKKNLSTLIAVAFLTLIFRSCSWSQCPEDPNDRGECDTLNVICLDCEQSPGSGPYTVRFPLLITHDQISEIDSVAGISIPLTYTHTNPSSYCSVSSYWNTTTMQYFNPAFVRSIFRHMLDGPDTLYANRMAQLEGDFSNRGWDFVALDLATDSSWYHFGINDSAFVPPHFWLTVLASGMADQRWWESERTLLATMTFIIEDTMHVCMDTTFWPPELSLQFSRSDAVEYCPRFNLPNCFWIGPDLPPDFTIQADPDTHEIQAGDSASFDLTLTSLFGFDSPCTLSVSGLPPEASAQLDDIILVPTDSTILRISTEYTTPLGEYDLTVTALEMGGSFIQHSIDVTLVLLHSDTLWIVAYSPVDLIVTDPVGDSIGLEFNTILGATYDTLLDVNEDGENDDEVTIPHALVGEYLIRVIAEPNAEPGDSYSVGIRIDGSMEILMAENAPVPPPGGSDIFGYGCLPYLRGDLDQDNETTLGDVLFLVSYLYKGGLAPDPIELADVNCDGVVDLGDLLYLISYLYKSGPPPCS